VKKIAVAAQRYELLGTHEWPGNKSEKKTPVIAIALGGNADYIVISRA